MLIINRASAGGVAYWQRSAVHTAWLGRGAELLGLSGAVEAPALRDVLQGRQPGGGPITDRPGLRRRHGWDLVFASPKSFSMLALSETGGSMRAPSDPDGAGILRAAFRGAVADAVGMLDDNAAWVRHAGGTVPARGTVAAAFEHVSSDAGQPHLHAHVVLANLGAKPAGGWGCLVGSELWRWREGLGPAFHLALRSRLGEAGLRFDWELSAGGHGEVVGVPRLDRAAASARSLAVRAGTRSFGSASGGASRMAQARTRRRAVEAEPGPPAPPALGAQQVAGILARARARPALPSPPPARGAVERALAERSSTFGPPDVLVALAETVPGGLNRRQMGELCRQWCEDSVAAPGAPAAPGRQRWTTAVAGRLDDQVVAAAMDARSAHLSEVAPALAWLELGSLGVSGQAAEVGARLACSGAGISVVPPGPWLAQAACIDAARAAWQAAGVAIRVSSPSEQSEWRWRALTSLAPAGGADPRGQTGPWGRAGPGRRVLVVDAANHLSPAALERLTAQGRATGTKLVLVPGGTVPGSAPSLARSFDQLIEALGPERLAPWGAGGTGSPAGAARPAGAAIWADGLVVRGALTGADALNHLVAQWRAEAAPPGHAGRAPCPMMVAFGPGEAEHLNVAARAAWPAVAASGAEVVLGERAYSVGDRVLALRRLGPVPGATRGTVVALGPQSLTVEWQGLRGPGTSSVGPDHARSLGYGYATTVAYLRSAGDAPLLVLGDPLQLGGRSTSATGWVTLSGPGVPAPPGPGGTQARRRAGLAELATGWPDGEMLARAGPRPLSSAARRRWADIVTACALERDLGLRRRPSASLDPGPDLSRGYDAVTAVPRAPAQHGPVPQLGR